MTTGIVSATGRVIGQGPYDDFVQTDASINPGNSGGPLINARGQAIGINAAIFSQSGGSVGIGFAIPSNQAKTVVTQLADNGHVSRGWLGVAIQPLTPELAKGFNLGDAKGALVASVTDDSPADEGGHQGGRRHHRVRRAQGGALGGSAADGGGDGGRARGAGDGAARRQAGDAHGATVAKLDEPDQKVAGEAGEKGKLGVAVEPVTPAIAQELGLKEAKGLVVKRVEDGSPAAQRGDPARRRDPRGRPPARQGRGRPPAARGQARQGHADGACCCSAQNATMYVAV